MNKIIVIGNLGRDPEMRYTPGGQAVTNFSVASNRMWTGKNGERNQEVEWFNVIAWGRLAESCNEHLAKGRQVFVEGRLQTTTWEGKNGEMRFANEIIVSDIQFLGQKAKSETDEGRGAPEEPQDDTEPPS